MKNIILLLVVSILACRETSAQDRLDGCWGLKFGMGQDSVIKIVKSKLSITPSAINKETIIYKNAGIETGTADVIKLCFYDGEFYGLHAFFSPEDQQEMLTSYRSMKDAISKQYFEAQISLTRGEATTGSIWNFPGSEGAATNGEILLSMGGKMSIQLSYLDGKRSEKVKKLASHKTKDGY